MTFHLHAGGASGIDELARRYVDLVVATQVARVVVGHLLVDAGDRGEAAFLDELVEQLRVMHNLKVAAELRVLATQRVEAVGAGDDDLARLDLVEDLNVLHRLHLKEELVACASRGIAGAGLALAQHHELHTGDGEQFGYRLGGALGTVLERARAADPEQVVDIVGDGVLTIRSEHAHVEVDLRDPGVAIGGVHAPWVALVLKVLEQAVEFGREVGGDHDLVASHVDEVVDVLDVDGALIDARPARGACPQGFLIDDRQLGTCGAVAIEGVAVVGGVIGSLARSDERTLNLGAYLGCQRIERRSVELSKARVLSLGCHQVRRLRKHRVAQVHDHELWRQGLAGVPGRALRLTAPTLGAGHEVDVVLPGEVGNVTLAECRIVGRILEVDRLALVVDRKQGAEGIGPARGVHVDRCGPDMQVLGVQDDQQEAHDDGDLGPDTGRFDPQKSLGRQPRHQRADPIGHEGTTCIGQIAQCCLRAAVPEQRDNHEKDHEKDQPRTTCV